MASIYRNCQNSDRKSVAVLDGRNIFWDCPGRGCPCPPKGEKKNGGPDGHKGRPMSEPYNKGKGKAVAWLREHANYRCHECLPWPFARVGGYGHFGHEGQMLYAHRFMCELVHGAAPTSKHHAAHSCGKGHEGCVNPNHLSWKTARENQLDRRNHGTKNIGYGQAGKLTPAERDWIVLLKGRATQAEIAALFRVKRGTVQYWHRERDAVPLD